MNQTPSPSMASRVSLRIPVIGHPAVRVIVAALLFGAATPASKPLLGHLSVVPLAAFLYLGAALGVSPIALRGGVRLPADTRDLRRLFLAILLGGVLAPIAILVALDLSAAASISLWLNLEVVATAVVGYLFFRDHLGRYGWLAVLGVFIAATILAVGEGLTGVLAGFLVAVGCTLWAFDNQFTSLIASLDPARTTFWKGLLAGFFNLVVAATMGQTKLEWGAFGLALLVGAVCYGLSIALYISGARAMGASRAQLVFAGAPYFGLLLSILFLHEPFALRYVFAIVLFAGSLLLLFRERHEHLHAHSALHHEHVHRHDDGHHTHSHLGLPPNVEHSHPHEHEPVTHSHPHWPDLHHRHDHPKGDA
jgi:drug/metabolite transporter (DMT)-like permease